MNARAVVQKRSLHDRKRFDDDAPRKQHQMSGEIHDDEESAFVTTKSFNYDQRQPVKRSRFVTNHDENKDDEEEDAGVSIPIPTRKLAIATILLLLISHFLLGVGCINAALSPQRDKQITTKWRVITSKQVPVRQGLSAKSKRVQFLQEGDEFEVFGDRDGRPYDNDGFSYNWLTEVNERASTATNTNTQMHVIYPINGWVSTLTKDGKPRFEKSDSPLIYEQDDSICPLLGAGYPHPTLTRFNYAPVGLNVAQTLWNAAQIAHLFLLICLAYSSSSLYEKSGSGTKILLGVVLVVTVGLLPFSVYVISPAAHAFAGIALGTSLVAASIAPSRLLVHILDGKAGMEMPSSTLVSAAKQQGQGQGQRAFSVNWLCKLETVAFLCNLGCSLYNYEASSDVWPHWKSWFQSIDGYLGLHVGEEGSLVEILVQPVYTLGFDEQLPLFVPRAYGSTTGHLAFLVIWSILPFLYTFYFGALYVMAKKTPGTRVQRLLCLFGMFHFLFLTDLVDYKYGRGLKNPIAEWCHWTERFAWRIAILVPIYQNIVTGHWRKGFSNRAVGEAVHRIMYACGVAFFVYQVLLNDVIHFPQWVIGTKKTHVFGLMFHGYHKMLVLMAILYGAMSFGGSSCHHIYIGGATTEKRRGSKMTREVKGDGASIEP